MNWNWIIAPIVGMVIGYGTNWLAVKMLFRPRREYRIGGHRIPFTPGAIPKGKPRLAKAVADAVTGSLLTKEDLKAKAMSPELTDKIIDGSMDLLTRDIDDLLSRFDPSSVETVKLKVSELVSDAVLNAVRQIPIADLIIEKGGNAIKEKIRGNIMLQMFVNDSMIASFADPVARAVNDYIDEEGHATVRAAVRREIDTLTSGTAAELLYKGGMDSDKLRSVILKGYTRAAETALESVLNTLKLGEVIENKINEMPVEELEELVMSVMKTELRTIVNLGAVIGLILGLVNALLNTLL